METPMKEKEEWSGLNVVIALFVAGASLAVFAGFVIGAAFPGTEMVTEGGTDYFGEYAAPEFEETGSMPGFIFGLLMAAISQVLLFIATVAVGVRIGVKPTAMVRKAA